MTVKWYVKHRGKVRGPFSPAQLKSLADTAQLDRQTPVRKGKDGKWVQAARVQGLYANAPPSADPKTKLVDQKTSTDDEGVFLTPLRRRRPRLIVFALLVAFIMIGRPPWYQQVGFALSMAVLLGTYPLVEIRRKYIERSMIVLFYPAHTQRFPLRDFVSIETDLEKRIADSVGCLILFVWVFRPFDYLMPWVGGDFKLWLRSLDDDRLLVWQGNNEHHFRINLETLESRTGLPVG